MREGTSGVQTGQLVVDACGLAQLKAVSTERTWYRSFEHHEEIVCL
jgi:hypothetical protein